MVAVVTSLTAAHVSPAVAHATPTYSVMVPSLPADERLIAFTIHIANGRVARLAECPPGWIITVNNDPSWQGSLQGNAVVGAAAIDARDLPGLVRLAPSPPEVRRDLPGRFLVTGTLSAMRDGGDVNLPQVTFRLTRHRADTR